MKNKKFTFGLILLMAGSLFFTNCTKNKKNEPPTPDSDVQSTKDITQLHMILSDIIELAGQGHDATGISPYISSTLTAVKVGTNTVPTSPAIVDVQTGPKYYSITFANTPGNDGHVRNGLLYFDYSATTSTVTASSIKHATPLFIAAVTATAYTVDDYSITINSMQIKNTTHPQFPIAPMTPSVVNLTWDISADINVAGPGGTRNLKANLTKTLLNTSNNAVPMPLTGTQTFTIFQGPAYATVLWSKAYVSYTGSGSGTNASGESFTYSLNSLTRNFNSSPEGYKYIIYAPPNTNSVSIVDDPERHPFLSGTMIFKEGSKDQREVDFGSGNVVDYNAKVTIKGITYDADCKD